MLAYPKCELAYLEFLSVGDIVMIKAALLEQLKTSMREICKCFVRNGFAHWKTKSSVLVDWNTKSLVQ